MDAQEISRKLFNPVNQICGTSALNGDLTALWSCFLTGAILNCSLCIVVYLLSEPILRLFFGGFFEVVKSDRPHHALSLAMEVVILVNATLTSGLVFFEAYILQSLATSTGSVGFELPARPSLWLATGALIGYMVWHAFMILYHRTLAEQAMGGTMFKTMLVHHGCSIFLFPVSLRTGLGCYFVAMFVQSELTSIPLAFRTFGLRMGVPFTSSLWFQLANIAWLVVWFLVRLQPMPGMWRVLSRANWTDLDWITYTICWFTYVPLAMNLWWTWLIVKGLQKQLCGKRKEPKKVKKR